MVEERGNRDAVVACDAADRVDRRPARQLVVEPTRRQERRIGADYARRFVVDELGMHRRDEPRIDAGQFGGEVAHAQRRVARLPHRAQVSVLVEHQPLSLTPRSRWMASCASRATGCAERKTAVLPSRFTT